MVKRHNRLLVAFHVVTDALLGMVAFVLAYFFRFETGFIPAPKGQPPLGQYLDILPYHRGRSCRSRSTCRACIGCAAGGRASTTSSTSSSAASSRSSSASSSRCTSAPITCRTRSAMPGAYEVSQCGWGIFLVFNIALGYLSRKLVREALERRWVAGVGLAAHPDRRRRRARSHGRRQGARTPRARLPDRRLRRRSRRRRSSRLSRPAAARPPRARPPRSSGASASTTSTSRCRSKST